MSNADETKDVEFYSVYDGKAGRPPGFYLDMKERHDAEDVRAKMEDREPNHEDEGSLPAAVGTMLVVPRDRVDNFYYSNVATRNDNLEDDVDPVVTLPVNVGTADPRYDLGFAAQVASERRAQDEALANETSDVDETGRTGNEPSDVLKDFSANSTDQKA